LTLNTEEYQLMWYHVYPQNPLIAPVISNFSREKHESRVPHCLLYPSCQQKIFFEITGNLINQKKLLINTRLINDVIIFRQVSGKIIVVLCIQAWIIRIVHVLKICITIGGQALRNPANLGNCPNFGGDHKKNSDTSDRIHTLLFSTLWEYRTLQNVWTWIFSSV